MAQCIKSCSLILYKQLCQIVYLLFSLFKRHDSEKVVIVTSRSKQLEGNLEFVYNELQNRIPKSKIHLIVANNKMNLSLLREIIILSNAKYLILDDYYLPIYLIKPRKSLKVIQLWHAAGAFKKFGYSTVGTKFGPDKRYLRIVPIHKNYTHVYVSSKNTVQYYAEAFNMSKKNVHPLGIPRIDLFSNERLKESTIKMLLEKNPVLKKEEVRILIAPTYRASGPYGESNFNMIQILEDIAVKLRKNVRILVRPHPYMCRNELKTLLNIDNISLANEFSINDWMLLSDAFITDYSSSIFDFSLLERPIAHFVPDLEEYTENRGFYHEIHEISDGEIIKDKSHLVTWINSREKNEFFDTSRMVKFNFDYTKEVSRIVVSHFISN